MQKAKSDAIFAFHNARSINKNVRKCRNEHVNKANCSGAINLAAQLDITYKKMNRSSVSKSEHLQSSGAQFSVLFVFNSEQLQ